MTLTEPALITLEPRHVALIRQQVALADIRAFFDRAFARVLEVLAAQGVAPAAAPVGIYRGQPTDVVDVACGFPTAEAIVADADVVDFALPAGRAVEAVHEGPYEGLGESYQKLAAWMAGQGLVPAPMMWEAYETEPTPDADPAAMRTRITWPVQD